MLEHRWLDKNAEAGSNAYGFQPVSTRGFQIANLCRVVSITREQAPKGKPPKRLATWLRNLKQRAESSKLILLTSFFASGFAALSELINRYTNTQVQEPQEVQ